MGSLARRVFEGQVWLPVHGCESQLGIISVDPVLNRDETEENEVEQGRHGRSLGNGHGRPPQLSDHPRRTGASSGEGEESQE